MANMEITTVIGCKVQCTFCPQPLLMNKYKETNDIQEISWGNPVVMDFDTFKICLDKIPTNVSIHFSGFSEPWLNPECTKMLLYTHEKNYQIGVYTTLVGMSIEDIDRFKHVPFQVFHVHLPDVQKYAKIALNKYYIEVLKKLLASNIHHLSFMSMGDLPDEIKQVLGMNFLPDVMINRAGNNEFGRKTTKKYGPLKCSMASKNGINLLDHNVLLPNGDVCMCCMDYGMMNVLGNLRKCEYSSLFKSKTFYDILEKLNTHDSNIMCRVCNVSVPVKQDENGLEEYYFCSICGNAYDSRNIGGFTQDGKGICLECSHK